MAFLWLILVMMTTTSSVLADDYLWKITCKATRGSQEFCEIPGMTELDLKYYKLEKIELYSHENDYTPCNPSSYYLTVRNHRPVVRVGWMCQGLFGIKSKVTGFPYKGQCGQNNYAYRIIKGENAKECQFPWMAYVKLDWKKGFRSSCGGSIISEKWILTAAHCIILGGRDGVLPPASAMTVRTGSMYKWDHFINRNIKRIKIHPEYNYKYLYNDIALMELTKPIKWDGCHAPVCLNTDKNVDNAKTLTCIISGWGTQHASISDYPQRLKFAYDRILSRSECNSIYGPLFNDRTLCGRANRYPHGGFCSGDSGGPLVCRSGTSGRYFQHGVVSLYFSYKNCAMEGLYSSVAGFHSWIVKTMRGG